MKIIHCADIHLGSRMNKFPEEKRAVRAREIRASFERLISYAKGEGITSILISGDLFDSDRPSRRDKEFFYGAVKNNADITFYYLRGNHDGKESYTEEIENLKTFGRDWTVYPLGGNVVVCGIEPDKNNCISMYSTLNLAPENVNIVMLHGEVDESAGEWKISLNRLKNKNIDYLALGHIHAQGEKRIDDRGIAVFCGCLEGRGFDECGKKGCMVYDTDLKKVSFVPFVCRTVEERTLDISDTHDVYGIVAKVKSETDIDPDNLLRLNLAGEIDYGYVGLEKDVQKYIEEICWFVSVKDNTRLKIDFSALGGSPSLKGEFIRTVSGEDMDEETRQKILNLGIKALMGQVD